MRFFYAIDGVTIPLDKETGRPPAGHFAERLRLRYPESLSYMHKVMVEEPNHYSGRDRARDIQQANEWQNWSAATAAAIAAPAEAADNPRVGLN